MADRRKEEMESRLSLYLHTAAELVTQVGTILDPEAFLSAAVTLLKERFGLYHVHVYTLDEKAGDLVMRAGYGEAGRVMKEQGHKIPLSSERSLVAQAARTREIVTVGDVTQDSDFLPNPLLPDTKSEMAIPLTIGEQVLGVFDIQDDALDRFSSVEVDVFRTLSGQLAVTLQNAQLFAERKQTEEALRRERRLFVGGPVVVFRWVNAEGWPVEYASPNLESFIGYSAEDLMNGVVPYANLVYPDDLMQVAEEVGGYTKEGRTSFEQEYRMVKANGDVIWIYDFTTIVRNERGEATHYDGYIMDITERKRAEEALEKRLVAMTQPLDDVSSITFEDLFNLADIQRLQDEFAEATGVASIITHPDGTPITRPSRFCHFCNDIVRKTGKGLANCYRSDAALGRLSPNGPTIQPCMSGGLWDAGAGISVGGRPVANWLIGQVRDETQTEDKIRAYAKEIEADEEIVVEAFREVPAMTYERFQQISQALFTLANQLSNSAYQNVQQARFIAERKQVEEQLKESEEKSRQIISRALVGIFRSTPAGLIVEGNPALLQILGYDSLDDLNRIGLPQIYDDPQVRARFLELLQQGPVAGFEAKMRRPDGTLVDIALSGSLIYDEEGKPLFLEGTFEDITERKQTEQALLESQTRLQALFNAIPDLIFQFDKSGTFLEYKAESGSELVAPPELFLGKRVGEVLPPVIAEVTLEKIKEALKTGEIVSYEYQLPVGETLHSYEARMAPSGGSTVTAMVRDITERKQADADRERFATRLGTAADIAAQVNTILDPDELLQTVIPLIKERFGLYYVHVYTVDEAEGVLRLRAGYGEPGRIMVERGHKIPLDAEKSLVARAARTQEMVLVDDVRADPEFLPNPLLPDTKSEVAVPAIAGGKVLGVFDVQHDVAHYFTESDLDVFRTLAGQIATAFQNAQLFAERKHAEEAAAQERNFANAVIDSLPGIFFMHDTNGKLVRCNKAYQEVFGFSDADLASVYALERFPEEERGAILSVMEKIFTGPDSQSVEGHLLTKNGKTPFNLMAQRLIVGGDMYLVGTGMDITDRKRAEEAIKEQQVFLDRVINAAPDLIFVKDYDSKYVLANRALAGLYGTTPEEMIGKTDADFSPTETEVEFFQAQDRKVIDSRQEVQIPEESIKDTQGREHWFQVVKLPLAGPSGKIDRVLGVGADITKLRQFATQLSTAADISTQVNTILDPDELLQTVIPLIKERFGLYYVHTYALDEAEGVLKLRAGYGEPGRIMVERGHHIPLDAEKSLVARAARTKEVVVVDDVRADPDFLPNPLLPDTRSEVAVPAIVGGRVLGVLDVQHDVAHYFTESDLDVFRTLNEQIATAFQNAELFAERKRAEEAAVREKNLADAVINSLPGIFFMHDTQGRLVRSNKAYQEAFGFSDEEMGSVYAVDRFPEDEQELIASTMGKLFTAGEQANLEAHLLTQEGKTPFNLIAQRLIVGGEAYLLGTGIDIKERKEAEQALLESRERLQALFNAIPDMIFQFDRSGTFLEYKAESGAELVAPPELFLGKQVGEVLPPAIAEVTLAKLKEALKTGEIVSYEYQLPMGETLHSYEARMAPSGGDTVTAMVRDITDRKQAEVAVRESEARLSQALRIAKMGYWEEDLATQTFIFNDQYYAAIHDTTAEAVGGYEMSAEEFARRFVVAEDGPVAGETFQKARAATDPNYQTQFETRNLTADGEERWVSVWFSVERDAQGNAVRFHGVNQDITERKQAESERTRFAERLSVAADISAQVNAILDPDELLATVIPLIKERFGLYYVHVYTVDEAEGVLRLRAGYGEPGRIMVERGHKIPLDAEKSLVARAARTQEMVLVDDVRADPEFLPNPLLPDTKSEVAVPAIAGGKVLGVFDVQHDVAGYFTEADLDVFRTLAGQIATAFQNASLYAASLQEKYFADTVINSLPGIFFMHDSQGKLVRCNKAYQESFGFSDADLANVVAIERFPEEEREFITSTLGKIFTTGELQSVEGHLLTKDGKTPFSLLAQRLIVGGEAYFIGTGIDITDRKRAEEQLKESEEKFRQIIGRALVGIFRSTPSGQIVEGNPALLRIMGCDSIEEINRIGLAQVYTNAKDRDKLLEALQLGPVSGFETTIQHPDGTLVDIALSASMVYDEEGKPLYLEGTFEDITERKRIEKAVQEQQAFLDQVINASPDLIFVKDYDSKYVLANQALAGLYGTTPEEMIGKTDADFSPTGTEVAYFQAQDRKVMDTQQEVLIPEESITDTQGREHWFQVVKLPLLGPSGKIDRVLGVGADITKLRQFTTQLSTAADISTQVNTELDPDTLLQSVIPLIKERFGLYYVHVYTVDEAEGVLRLRAGYGEPGRIMVERGHKIPLDAEKSLVARAARTKQVVAVDDVRADPEFLPNPLLPDTQSEVAVPMVVGDRVLGVFDVQHDEVAYFTESYLDVFSTLAGQIATAFQNAQLFAERKRAEEGLKRERRLFVGGPVVVFRWVNAEGWPVEYASPNMASFIGYTAEDLMNGVVPYANLVYPDDLMHVAEEVERYTEEGQTSFEQEYRMVKANGDVIWIYDFTTIIRNERGEVTHYDGYIMDITERKRAEESMAQEKYFADTVINSLPGIFFMHDTNGKLVRCNKAYQELFGFSDEDLENVYAQERFPEEERESILSVMGKIFTEPELQSVEGHLLTKDGETPFNLLAQRLITGGEVYLLGTGTDITERKQAEAERQRFTNQLGTAAEVATRANAILDPDELLNAVVALVKERFDLYHAHVYTFDEKSQELVLQAGYGEPGRVMKEQGHKIALDAEQSLVAHAARARELVVVDDVTKESGFMSNPLLPDTRSEVAVPLMVGDRLLGVFDVQDAHVGRFVAGDLSVLQTLAGQVSTALQNALYFDEIQKTSDRLREMDRLKSEFLANMSHELRTPLNSIIGYSEVLMMGIDGDLEPETLEDIKAIYDNGQHLLAMINDVLDLAKIEAGRMTLKIEELDLTLMVEEVKSATMGLFHKKPEVEFQVTIDEGLPDIRGDRIRLSQVLINLVSNAEKFTEKGHVKVHAYRQGRHWTCVAVEDTGIGIPEDQIGGLFEKFHQVDGSSKRRAQGTGLGLAISRELVQLHGGRIEVRSKYGEGSCFTVWLPVAE